MLAPLMILSAALVASLHPQQQQQQQQGYIVHNSAFCASISCSDARCTGGIHYGNEDEPACRALCDAAACACYDWRDGSKVTPAQHPAQPNCRLTNSSVAVTASGYGYAAYASTAPRPPPTPAPPPPLNAWINYGCRREFASRPWCDAGAPLEARLDALVGAMNVSEKASQLTARSSPPIDRLGVPFFCWGQNAINDILPQQFSAFPIPPAMAATFNMSAVAALGATVAQNARVLFNRRTSNHSHSYTCPGSIVTWGPTINIDRDPRWGRNFEVPSEDPYLSGAYAAAFARGAQQGEDPRFLKTIVTVKHWAAYSVDRYSGPDRPTPAEHGRDRYTFNAVVDPYNFWDTYAPPFEAAVTTLPPRTRSMPAPPGGNLSAAGGAGARGVMCSYNELNGVPACYSPFLRDVLRGDFGFSGYVTSDTDAISSANNHHCYHNDTNSTAAPTTPLEALTYGLRDGRCDVESSVGSANWYVKYAPQFVADGTLDEALLDAAVRAVFRVRFEAGLFDPGWEDQPYAALSETTDGAADVRQAERDAIVLLQNDGGLLPFALPQSGSDSGDSGGDSGGGGGGGGDGGGYSLALIGPYASKLEAEAKLLLAPGGGTVIVQPGCQSAGSSDTSGFAAALAAARLATHVVLVLGSDASFEKEYNDRTNVTLPGVQAELAAQLLADCANKTAVVLTNRGALAVDGVKAGARAVLLAWEFGGDGGGGPIPAALDAVFGAFSPAGRLPYTMYDASFIEAENFFEMSMTAPPGRSYKYYEGTPLWPFGWGLSYASFDLALAAANSSTALPLRATVSVSNTGQTDGDEVVQLYFAPKWTRTDAPLPKRQLIDFARVHLKAGEEVALDFVVVADQLRTVHADGTRSLVPGAYDLVFTNGAHNTVQHTVTIGGK